MTGLLDTAVVVDLLRLYPPASDWLAGQPTLGLSQVVWLEIIEGASDSQAQERALKLLRRFELIEVLPEDFDWAIRQAIKLRLSHNVGTMDCLIASSAQRLGLPLYSRNLKHFSPLLGGLAQAPY